MKLWARWELMTHSYLKASQTLFNSVVSINLQTNVVKGSNLNVIVLSLLCSVLGLGETVS